MGEFLHDAQYLVVCGCDGAQWSKIVSGLSAALSYLHEQEGDTADEYDCDELANRIYDWENWENSNGSVPFRIKWDGEQSYTEIILITPPQSGE